jgi:RNA polymerase sigma-70 factor (ECF subfamily)
VASGLNIIDAILSRGDLQNYYLAHSARGEFLKRLGNLEQAKLAFERALSLTQQEVEQRFLRRKLAEIDRIR